MIPLLYALLPNKKCATYKLLLKLIKVSAKQNGLKFQPDEIQIDYERACIKAFQTVFPKTRIKGCFFHYTQAIWKNVKKHGLAGKQYRGNARKIIRIIMALPLLNPEDMADTWTLIDNLIINSKNKKLAQLKIYFNRTWYSKHSNAMFSQSMWNHHGNFKTRTNNHLEGWHNILNKHLMVKHPNLYKLLTVLKSQQLHYNAEVILSNNGCPPRPMKIKYKRRNKKLKILMEEYKSGDLMPIDFLNKVGSIMQE